MIDAETHAQETVAGTHLPDSAEASSISDEGTTQPAPAVRRPPGLEEAKEITRRGWELYERQIRDKVEPQCNDKFMSVDVDSGEYAIADDPLIAAKQLIAKNPHVRLYGLRIGSRAMYKV